MYYLAKDLFNQIIAFKGKILYALLCYIIDIYKELLSFYIIF